jgi:DtxR family Mn-dependent transcriptional regulator
MTTESTEMYLETVYRLTEEAEYTKVSDIAYALGLNLSSVSEKVKKMAEEGLLEHQWREVVSLSEAGKQRALRILRKRRLIETFLFNLAGYEFDEVHEEACRLEHIISDRLADSLESILGFPQRDPHGHPIPSRDGVINHRRGLSLSQISGGKTVRIIEFYRMDDERLRYLRELGLKPQISCKVLQVAPFYGPLTIEVGQDTITIDHALASLVSVEPEEQEIDDD